MKSYVVYFIALVPVLIVFCCGQRASVEHIENLLQDRHFVNKQINCVLGKARCDEFGKNLRASIPKVLQDSCRSCTPEESEVAEKIIGFVKANHPDVWENVSRKYSRNS
ncbi:hypothetical protein PGB90_001037 [Kerria lacca]